MVKKIILVVATLCLGVFLTACFDAPDDTPKAPEGITQSVYDDALKFIEMNDRYDAGEIDIAAAREEADALYESLESNSSTDLDKEIVMSLKNLNLKYEENKYIDEDRSGLTGTYERSIERAKDRMGIE